MPNGGYWTKEQWQAIEAFFERVGPVLTEFARAHNLKIDRYYHEAPSWSLLFKHPTGGAGRIDVERVDDDAFRLGLAWWIDDVKAETRFLRMEQGAAQPADSLATGATLIDALRDVISWIRESLAPRTRLRAFVSPPHDPMMARSDR